MGIIYIQTRWTRKAPACTKGKRHDWKQGSEVFGETGICAKCGYDAFEQRYRKVEQ